MQRLDFVGVTLFLSGILLFGLVHLAIANYIPNMGSWSQPPGKLATVLNDGLLYVPYVLSIILIIIGAILLFQKEIKALLNKIIKE